MHPKTRTATFAIFVFLFIVVGAYALLVSFGFAVNLAEFRIIRTGSLYFDYVPAAATLTINGVPQRKPSWSFIERGMLVKHLVPDTYKATLGAPSSTPWQKTLQVRPGEVTKMSGVIVWPHASPRETIASDVRRFSVTKDGVVTTDTRSHLSFNISPVRGDAVAMADADSSLLVTKEATTKFLVDLQNPKEAVNLSELFQSLKERQLKLPGAVTIKWMLPHPFSPSKLLIGTERALYSLDARKMALEKIVGATSTAAVSVSGREALIAERGGAIIAVDLMLNTVNYIAAFSPLTPVRMGEALNGAAILALTDGGTLLEYRRDTDATSTLARAIADFAVAPDDSKLAMRGKDGALSFTLLKDSEENTQEKAGMGGTISCADGGAIKMAWLPDSSRYLLILDKNGTLAACEADMGAPQNHKVLAEGIADFAAQNETLYILRTDGVLGKMELLVQ